MTGQSDRSKDFSSSVDAGRSARTRFVDLLPRIGSGALLAALAISTAVLGGPWFGALWWAAALAIFWEWQTLVGGPRLGLRLALGGAALSVAGPLVSAGLLLWAGLILIGGALAVGFAAGRRCGLYAGAGAIYAAALLVAVVVLRNSFPYGLESIFWLFAVVWGTDVMAYFAGRSIGGPKLWPRVSPSKTWSGFLVGITSGALAGVAVAPSPGPYLVYFGLGLAGGAIAQGGDLFESSFKRRFGVKDSSRLIPGHGGVMDRLDGFVVLATAAAILGLCRFGVDTPGAGLFRW